MIMPGIPPVGARHFCVRVRTAAPSKSRPTFAPPYIYRSYEQSSHYRPGHLLLPGHHARRRRAIPPRGTIGHHARPSAQRARLPVGTHRPTRHARPQGRTQPQPTHLHARTSQVRLRRHPRRPPSGRPRRRLHRPTRRGHPLRQRQHGRGRRPQHGYPPREARHDAHRLRLHLPIDELHRHDEPLLHLPPPRH